MSESTELADALAELKEKRVHELVAQKLAAGEAPLAILQECNAGMGEVGRRFQAEEYYLSELMFSAEIFNHVMESLGPLLGPCDAPGDKGLVVIGTVRGDIHDIGKNIVIALLRGVGFQVIDLGVDVPAERFVEAVRTTGTKLLGLSALLSLTYPEMKTVIDKLAEAGLRDRVSVIIGGAPCNEEVRLFCGADYYAKDAAEGVDLCRAILDVA